MVEKWEMANDCGVQNTKYFNFFDFFPIVAISKEKKKKTGFSKYFPILIAKLL